MTQPITVRIRGSGPTDAPTVSDFVDQLRDILEIISGVEAALGDGATAIDWRITQATTNSPIAIEATPYPKQFGVDIGGRVQAVKMHAASGIHSLMLDAEPPAYFNQAVIGRLRKVAQRVTNGLSETQIDWGDKAETVRLTPERAAAVERNVDVLLRPKVRSFTERGSLEGFHDGLAPDPSGKHVLFVRSRRTGDRIKCILTTEAYEELRHREIGEVLDGRRVRVRGTLFYKGPHRLDRVTAEHVSIVPRREELPSLNEIIDPDFTGGMRTEDYLEALRGGRVS